MSRGNVIRSVAVSAVFVFACTKRDAAIVDTTTPSTTPAPAPSSAAAAVSDSMVLVRGSVTSVSATQVVVKTDSTTVTVATPQAVQVFMRGPSDLSHVAPNSFVGVTTVKQADGTERATEIHIFPDELRGLGEGSRMMTTAGAASSGPGSRMTNGAVSGSQMTNGTTASKMSNGSVSSTNGTTLIVQFAGGSTTAVVPANTPVTEIKPTDRKLAAGDQVTVIAARGAGGSLTSHLAMLSK